MSVRFGYLYYDKLLGSENQVDRINSAIVLDHSTEYLRTFRRARRFLTLQEKIFGIKLIQLICRIVHFHCVHIATIVFI